MSLNLKSADASPGIEDDQSLCALLVHDTVSTLSASDRVSGPHFVLVMALSTHVDHGGLEYCVFGTGLTHGEYVA